MFLCVCENTEGENTDYFYISSPLQLPDIYIKKNTNHVHVDQSYLEMLKQGSFVFSENKGIQFFLFVCVFNELFP